MLESPWIRLSLVSKHFSTLKIKLRGSWLLNIFQIQLELYLTIQFSLWISWFRYFERICQLISFDCSTLKNWDIKCNKMMNDQCLWLLALCFFFKFSINEYLEYGFYFSINEYGSLAHCRNDYWIPTVFGFVFKLLNDSPLKLHVYAIQLIISAWNVDRFAKFLLQHLLFVTLLHTNHFGWRLDLSFTSKVVGSIFSENFSSRLKLSPRKEVG